MLGGVLFQQALTEAIWAVTIARAAWNVHHPLLPEQFTVPRPVIGLQALVVPVTQFRNIVP